MSLAYHEMSFQLTYKIPEDIGPGEIMRAFFCLELPKNVKGEIKSTAGSIKSPAYVKWVSRENLHVTLKFLGDVDRSQVTEIKERARGTAGRLDTFEVTIDKLGGFPKIDFPKVIWLGSESPPNEIFRLHKDLEESLISLGFERENRDYVPHITLGRTKEEDPNKVEKLGTNLQKLDLDVDWQFKIEELTLMESKLKSDGPVYNPVFRVGLGN
ncbi:RNA 2',3'-cyclic phosphodiesterase [Candidatus Bipolaricaulota bacterium]|nr:RNA 2',3'-cyclic phosphodiesterase [Candidatus Bipolaricaulota bacterium]MBS3825012.1 RNA 2',3'-cyclic phosphodiesterase [Candidatus Bipolaricaulota bacterium]